MVEFTVTVPAGTGGGYYIDGVQKPIVPVVTGGTFRFNQNAANNNGHPLILSTTTSTAGIISTGVSYYLDGASNQTNYLNTALFNAATVRYIEITVAQTVDFFYLCNVHGSGMGNSMDVTSDTWGALGWNIGKWGAQNDTDVAITGQNLLTNLSSVSVDFQPEAGWGIAGWGIVPWGEEDDIIVSLTGQNLTANLNSVIASIDVNIDVTGQNLIANLNSVTALADANVDITGQNLTGNLNSVEIFIGTLIELTGQNLTASLNSIDVAIGNLVEVVGQQLTTTLNGIDVVITQDGFGQPTGQNLTSSLNSVEADAITLVDLTGQNLTTSLNSVTAFTDVTVNLTGNSLTIALNSINNQIWTEINTGTAATWTEIDTAA